MRLRLIFVVVLVCTCARMLHGQQYSTLLEALQQAFLPAPPAWLPHRTALITSYATLNDQSEFVIAYYLADSKTQLLAGPLYITRFEKTTARWQHVAIDGARAEAITGNTSWQGSVLEVFHKHDQYYVYLHWGPDAGCLLVLDHELALKDAVLGWPQGWFQSGALIYTKNMIHFADVHPATLWLYDPTNHTSQQLYPQPIDPLREAFSKRLAKVIDDDRCRLNNWACNPQSFTTEIDSVVVNDSTKSFAARLKFEPDGFVPLESAQESGAWDDAEYAYIYQLQPFQWREFAVRDLKPKFGSDSLEELLTPDGLEKVFATPAPQ